MEGKQLPVDRTEVERRPTGSYWVAISGPDFWADEANKQTLLDSLSGLVADTLADLPGIRFLRHIAVHPDVPETIHYWQRELGLPEIVTSAEQGAVFGKSLLWGSGDEDSTYALLVLSESIAHALVDRSGELAGCAASTVVHELAHVHDYWRVRAEIGDVRWPMNNDWGGIKRFLASNAWSEYFAERTAAPFSQTPHVSLEWWFSKELLGDAVERLQAEIAQFRWHGDANRLWNHATDQLSNLLNSLGRGLGAADALGTHDLLPLLDSANLQLEKWLEIAESAREGLRAMYAQSDWGEDTFDTICPLVESVFRAAGIVAQQRGDQLRIDCPW